MCPLTVDYSWGYTMPCKKHYSYTWTKGYGSDRLNAGGDEDGWEEGTHGKYSRQHERQVCRTAGHGDGDAHHGHDTRTDDLTDCNAHQFLFPQGPVQILGRGEGLFGCG